MAGLLDQGDDGQGQAYGTDRAIPVNPTSSGATAYNEAMQQYPILQKIGLQGKTNLGGGNGYLEFWHPQETGTPEAPRPSEFHPNSPGVEIYRPDTKPSDVLADATSHWMIHNDPAVKSSYDRLEASISPRQETLLQNQYAYAQKHDNESRSYEDWRSTVGMPSFLRGYTFEQWPKSFTDQVYTPEQKANLDGLRGYLGYAGKGNRK